MASPSSATFDKNTQALEVAATFPSSIKGHTILITGVNKSGTGHVTAEAFASQSPHTLILAGRSQTKITESISDLRSKYPTVILHPLIVDLSSLTSIRTAAATLLTNPSISAINIIINNAGIMRHGESHPSPVPKTQDGIEEMLGTNHIGHFLLTNLLMPKLLAATASSSPTRIINLSSSGTWVSPLRASDLSWSKPASQLPENERPNFPIMVMAGMTVAPEATYMPTAAYGQSKTCGILFSVALNERLFDRHGILSLSVDPGEVKTELGRNTDREWLDAMIKRREDAGMMHWKTLGGGASTTLVAACDPGLTRPGRGGVGVFLGDCQVAKAPAWAVDENVAERLWRISEELVGQRFGFD